MNLKWNAGNREMISSDQKINRKSNLMKKAAVIIMLASSITFNIGFAKDNESGQLQKIFHIYASGEYVGAVSEEKAINGLVEQIITETSSQYDALSLKDGTNLSIISEQVFNSNTNDTETLDKLEKLITVEADAFALSVNDEIAVYVKDLESYHEVVRKLKLQSVPENEFIDWETRNDATDSLPPLKSNETRILDISIKESISGVTQQVKPESIVTIDQAVDFLQKGTLEEKIYTVQAGDVFGRIAANHQLSSTELSKLNTGVNENSVLRIGQELNVTALKPLVNVEVVREKKVTEEIPFNQEVRESDDMLKGDSKVIQKGIIGEKEMTYIIKEQNGNRVGKTVKEEKVIKETKNNIVIKGTKVISSRGSGKLSWPAEGGYVSSNMGHRWGRFHSGIDIARPSGYTIKAADNGTVTFAGHDGTYGNKVVVNHNNGYQTVYGHLSSISVSKGQTVPVGTKLGVMGSTGRSTGTHLHFEVLRNGENLNPLKFLR
ncbi:M23 family metallopeptidase [Paenisporosarcina indica]|uniref:M23 family metallopeptidase n=1 Tax=Paenisporosarcina indica TaxID=650093 RepID=UPI000A043BF5|nr:M23 family metallopeptidase [Paenisporosarcina indica]